ncbi:hypothetical protein DXB38_11920 [Blautia obeum]|uniref:Uncharacterized protein n=1 Tax=Blautia obeum TaxID=40520 RepID=A0A3E5ECQ5_9FIRM|nr:hypothetical protein DXB38_11920 [Blautia obeum]
MRVETLIVRARSTTIGILCLYSTQYEPPTEYTLSFCRFFCFPKKDPAKKKGEIMRYGKKMFNDTLKYAIDHADYEAVELLIALAREDMCLACVLCEDYLAARSGKDRRKVIDRIPGHIAMLQARAANGGVDPEQN